ncbi:HIT family protein [Candidatus Woesearchaeota archaeon]|nr:HIT family protein [Candidatus Woesearchaeota archaeon]HIH38280.1 HIT family protein [Candidatus Woesearchaeota archaeon]HIH49146.1 HIT family protein [Candidatus Woesearchaeota archaeon]HIJ04436.1 HIT family protein [Candidatus Woesearchaeota archaeon]
MPEMTPEMKEALQKQKEQCPFCKIISGEMFARKAYEDDKIIAVLDINPAAKGHLLVMPKEHYPIMPLIPYEDFTHLFLRAKELAVALEEGMISFGTTLFIANGWIAGQQSQHFMLHLLPREKNDRLGKFYLSGKKLIDHEKHQEAIKLMRQYLPQMMDRHFQQHQEQWHRPPETKALGTSEAIKLIESHPQLGQILISSPDTFMDQIGAHPQLKRLFAKVDMKAVGEHFGVSLGSSRKIPLDKFRGALK